MAKDKGSQTKERAMQDINSCNGFVLITVTEKNLNRHMLLTGSFEIYEVLKALKGINDSLLAPQPSNTSKP